MESAAGGGGSPQGSTGHLAEAPAGRLLRDAKLYEIGGGTHEIRRLIIGRELFNHGA